VEEVATPVAEGFMEAVEVSMGVVGDPAEAVAGAMRTVAEASPAEVIAAGDPCLDTAARLAGAVVMRAALMVAHPMRKVALVEAGLA
jgi:hypothetical protein